MGYELTLRRRRVAAESDAVLHLSVWEMSTIRDRMLRCGAAFCAEPPNDLTDLTRRHAGIERGIPAYKLAMIDGFVVRPDEIREALRVIASDKAGATEDDTWKVWIDFLKLALDSGGFRVE